MKAVHHKISESSSRKFLFILDNVDDYKEVEKYVNSKPYNLEFLITSREKIDVPVSIKLNEFTLDQAQAYIKKVLKGAVTDSESKELANKVGKLPIRLGWVVKFVDKYKATLDVGEFIKKY
jgi:hypothetical protein